MPSHLTERYLLRDLSKTPRKLNPFRRDLPVTFYIEDIPVTFSVKSLQGHYPTIKDDRGRTTYSDKVFLDLLRRASSQMIFETPKPYRVIYGLGYLHLAWSDEDMPAPRRRQRPSRRA